MIERVTLVFLLVLTSLVGCSPTPRLVRPAHPASNPSPPVETWAGPFEPRFAAQPFQLAMDRGRSAKGWSVSLSHDGTLIASAGADLVLVEARSGVVRGRLPLAVTEPVFNLDDTVIAAAGRKEPNALYLWDLRLDELHSLPQHQGFSPVTFTREGALVVRRGDAVRWVNVTEGSASARFNDPAQPGVTVVHVAEHGDRLLARVNGALMVVEPGKAPRAAAPIVRARVEPEYSADLRRVAVVDESKKTTEGHPWLGLQDVDTGRIVERIPGLGGCTHALNQRGDRIAAVCKGIVSITDIEHHDGCKADTPAALTKIMARQDWSVLGLRFSEDGARLGVEYGNALHGSAYAFLNTHDCSWERVYSLDSRFEMSRHWSRSFVGVGHGGGAILHNGGGPLVLVSATEAPYAVPSRLVGLFSARGEGSFPDPSQAALGPDKLFYDLQEMNGSMRYVYDARKERFDVASVEILEPLIKTPFGVLHAVSAGGFMEPVRGINPSEIFGPFVLLSATGARVTLAGSAVPGAVEGTWESRIGRFLASERGTFITAYGAGTLWDGRTGRRVLECPADTHGSVKVSPGEDRAVLTCETSPSATTYRFSLVDLRTRRALHASRISDIPTTVAWSSHGDLVAVDRVGVLDAATGRVLWAPAPLPLQMMFSPDGRLIALALYEGAIEIRNAKTGARVARLEAEFIEGWANEVMLTSPLNGERRDHVLWDTRTWAERARLGPYLSASLTRDGRFVLFQREHDLGAYRVADGEVLLHLLARHPGQRGFSFTSRGLFDGEDPALGALYRIERDVRRGRLVPFTQVNAHGHRPGLAAAFFAGKPIQ